MTQNVGYPVPDREIPRYGSCLPRSLKLQRPQDQTPTEAFGVDESQGRQLVVWNNRTKVDSILSQLHPSAMSSAMVAP